MKNHNKLRQAFQVRIENTAGGTDEFFRDLYSKLHLNRLNSC